MGRTSFEVAVHALRKAFLGRHEFAGGGWMSYDTHLLGVAKVRTRFWDALGVALFRHFLQRL